MQFASGQLTGTSQPSGPSGGSDQGSLAFDGLSVAVSLIGVAGTLLVFAALNMLNRLAPAKVRKR
jgi:hypothetical protein